MDQRFLFLFLFTGVLLHVLSPVRGNCISEGVSFMNTTHGDKVLLQLNPKIEGETQQVKWYFKSKNLRLLTISPGESRPSWIIKQKEYKDRLFVTNDGSLILTNLTSEDTGCYEAEIMSVTGKIHIQKFNLTVSDSGSTKSNMKAWSWLPVLLGFLGIGVLLPLIAVCVCLRYRRNCLNLSRGIQRRIRNIPPVLSHREQERIEERCTLAQMAFLPDQETQRTLGTLPTTTTQDNEGVTLARVGTSQERS